MGGTDGKATSGMVGIATETDTFRLVNGEGDGLSGLVVDIVGVRNPSTKCAVIMSSAAWCEIHKSVVLSSVRTVLGNKYDPIWKTTPSRLKQDGYDGGGELDEENGNNINTKDTNSYQNDCDENRRVTYVENGVRYIAYPFRTVGQKTSVYCDQRTNRLDLASYCNEKRVLDLCCYHGGFALNAMIHGNAQHVVGVDSSQ